MSFWWISKDDHFEDDHFEDDHFEDDHFGDDHFGDDQFGVSLFWKNRFSSQNMDKKKILAPQKNELFARFQTLKKLFSIWLEWSSLFNAL